MFMLFWGYTCAIHGKMVTLPRFYEYIDTETKFSCDGELRLYKVTT